MYIFQYINLYKITEYIMDIYIKAHLYNKNVKYY